MYNNASNTICIFVCSTLFYSLYSLMINWLKAETCSHNKYLLCWTGIYWPLCN